MLLPIKCTPLIYSKNAADHDLYNRKMACLSRGGGQVVSVLAFYSDDPSSNPAEVYNFSIKLLLKRTKINQKEAGVGPLIFFKKMTCFCLGIKQIVPTA